MQAAPAPSTSPVANQVLFVTSLNSAPAGCPYNYGCAYVPYGGGWYVFKFYYYRTYYLSNWFGVGPVVNFQSAGAAMRLYNSAGAQITCIPADSAPTTANWDPVWSIRLTSSPC
ncbi:MULTISPECIES: hypothetical protein [Parafrankia]|uniref:hypothetical protein n=1 Tax=Parafrankia TaxID=2994362 RepID=UPI001868D1A9|nr:MULTISPECIES: hypothetical protein [Parafrankia]MBE3200184.1 hypothetical protein [Parafrankia sp. CH37]